MWLPRLVFFFTSFWDSSLENKQHEVKAAYRAGPFILLSNC